MSVIARLAAVVSPIEDEFGQPYNLTTASVPMFGEFHRPKYASVLVRRVEEAGRALSFGHLLKRTTTTIKEAIRLEVPEIAWFRRGGWGN